MMTSFSLLVILNMLLKGPNTEDRSCLGSLNHTFPDCIGFIDDTLVEIGRMWKNALHSKGFNNSKKIYCMNNTVIVSHEGLFMHVDLGHPKSFHNITILKHSRFYCK